MRSNFASIVVGAVAAAALLVPQATTPPPTPDLGTALLALAASPEAAQTTEEQALIDALNTVIDQRIGSVSVTRTEFDAVAADVADHETRITALEADVGTLQTDLGNLDARVTQVETDLANLSGPTQAEFDALNTEVERIKTELGEAAGGGTTGLPVPDDYPSEWPTPDELSSDEAAAVESAEYLYSTWYGSPQEGMSPAAMLAIHRGATFERFLQFGQHEYWVPMGSITPGADDGSISILGEAIVDTAWYLCPDATWPEFETDPAASSKSWVNVLGPGSRMLGFSDAPNPVHCYWSHMPSAEWDRNNPTVLFPSPTFDEVWR